MNKMIETFTLVNRKIKILKQNYIVLQSLEILQLVKHVYQKDYSMISLKNKLKAQQQLTNINVYFKMKERILNYLYMILLDKKNLKQLVLI